MDRPTDNRLDRPRRLLLLPLAGITKLWARTLRFRVGAEGEEILRDTSAPTILVVWHNRLFPTPEVYRRYRAPKPTCGLVSASRDGAWLAAFMELMKVAPIRGSSSRGGREALSEIVRRLGNGEDVAITPDGPRGPAYSFKPGAAIAARRARARVVVVGMAFSRAWRLKSWDRFYLPVPFSAVELRARSIAIEELPDRVGETAEWLRKVMEEVNAPSGEADFD